VKAEEPTGPPAAGEAARAGGAIPVGDLPRSPAGGGADSPGRAPGSLAGVGVAVTRGEGPDGPLTVALENLGARVLDWGSIAFAAPEDPGPLLSALARLPEFDWVIFSSPRAVEAVVGRLEAPPADLRCAAVGPSTAASLQAAGWPAHRVPEEGTGEGMVEIFRRAGDAAGARVLFPASAVAREVIPSGLAALGATVERVTAYRLVTLPLDPEACRAAVEAEDVQVVTFGSPSALKGLREGIGENLFLRLSRTLPAAAMGPTTAGALREAGWRRIIVAEEPTLEALAEAALRAAW
jgi:uroporphyrinogen-III synthase